MASQSLTSFPNVQSCGQLLPMDALQRILNRDPGMDGLSRADFHLVVERLNEAINRSWQKLLVVWRNFRQARGHLAVSEPGTGLTRENWLLPLFNELGYGRLSSARAEQRQVDLPDGLRASYAISHFWLHSPIHLIGCGLDMDKRTKGIAGAAQSSPHSLVQEFLNRSDAHLWGFVSNGLLLRILRDNASLSRQAYVEFNLEGIFEGESFSEFALLWMCCHQSRVEAEKPENCWLERWSREAQHAAVAALDTLRGNVTGTIQILGQGFMEANPALRRGLAEGALDRQDFFRRLLRLVYRLIFLFVVEERNLLQGPDASPQARERYERFWSLARLRRIAERTRGSKHHDLWEGIKRVMLYLGDPRGCAFLGLAPMGGFLWSAEALPDIARWELFNWKLFNADLLDAVRRLAFIDFSGERRPVDWRHLGARELGSVYESLLELHPVVEHGRFCLEVAAGNERKTSGSYYTPSQLINSLLDSALDPVIDRAVQSNSPETALLNLKICDPACGSGHFLLAAAQRVAKRLASLRTGDGEPAPSAQRHALREVVARCLYGMDINPMSVELCKVGLWLETHEPGKPLSFLDHHLRCANSLMGTTAEAIRKGIPDSAYAALDGGDGPKAAAALKKSNASSRRDPDQRQFDQFEQEAQAVCTAVQSPGLEDLPSDTVQDMEQREQIWRQWQTSRQWRRKKFLYDLWTAAFVLPRLFLPREDGRRRPDGTPLLSDQPLGVTWHTLVKYIADEPLPPALTEEVRRAAKEYQFFHYEVMFPEVAAQGGFDAVLANPPWERIKLQEKEWFAAHNYPDIAEAPNAAARRKKIAALKQTDSLVWDTWNRDRRKVEGQSHYLRNSKVYPLCGRGDINLYAVFAEWMRQALHASGRLGCIVPSGIATDDTTKHFFQDMLDTESLVSLYDFENREKIFPSIDSRIKFSLLTAGSGERPLARAARFVFFAHAPEELRDPEKCFTLSPADIRLLNPNTRTCPIFRSSRDAELTKAVYRRVPVLIREARDGRPEENPWGIRFRTMFHMSNDSHLFRTREQLEDQGWELRGNVFEQGGAQYLPLYEAKMIHHFNHRWATYRDGDQDGAFKTREVTLNERQDPEFRVLPRYWVEAKEVRRQLDSMGWNHEWLMGWRDICRSTDERTVIFAVFPMNGVGNTMPIFYSIIENVGLYNALAIFSSFIFDFVARQKVGGTHLTYGYLNQLPLIPSSIFATPAPWQPSLSLAQWLRPRILELTYTAGDLRPFARDMGYAGPPFGWDEERRFQLRAELDAAFFHLYLPANPDGTWKRAEQETAAEYTSLVAAFPTPRAAVDFIMDTFPITRKKDEAVHGRYRTKERILHDYDAMLETGKG